MSRMGEDNNKTKEDKLKRVAGQMRDEMQLADVPVVSGAKIMLIGSPQTDVDSIPLLFISSLLFSCIQFIIYLLLIYYLFVIYSYLFIFIFIFILFLFYFDKRKK